MQNKSFGEEFPQKPNKKYLNFKPSDYEAVSLKFSSVICIDNLLKKQHNPYKKLTFSSFETKTKYSFNDTRVATNQTKKQLQPHKRKLPCHSLIDNVLKYKQEKSMPFIKQNKVFVFKANRSVEKKQQYFDFSFNNQASEQSMQLKSKKVYPIPKIHSKTEKLERSRKIKSIIQDRYIKDIKDDNRSASQSNNHDKILPVQFRSENASLIKNYEQHQSFKPKLGRQRFKHSKNPFNIPKNSINEQKYNTIAKKLRLLTQKNQHFFNFLHRNNSTENLLGKCQDQIQQEKIELTLSSNLKFDNNDYQLQTQTNNNFFSRSICVTEVDYSKGQLNILYGKNQQQKCEIASITKVMTCLLAIIIADKFNINLQQQKIFTSEKAARMPGTTANLQYSDQGTIMELLYGMMLPSGNDAAVAIAQWGGKTIRKYCGLIKRYRNIKSSVEKTHKIAPFEPAKKSFIKLFLIHMNKLSKNIGLQNTFFANSHGLMNQKSYSTARDVVKLASIAMQNQKFRKIVSTKSFQCKLFNRTLSQHRTISWQNTNKLLGVNGFVGVKTGITPSAGPCLVSQYQIDDKYCFVICILKTKSMEMRFKQSLAALVQAINIKLRKNAMSSEKKLEYLKILERLGEKNIDYSKFVPSLQQPKQDVNNMKTINSSEDQLDKQQISLSNL